MVQKRRAGGRNTYELLFYSPFCFNVFLRILGGKGGMAFRHCCGVFAPFLLLLGGARKFMTAT